jgi:hypothetical protein
MRIHPIAIHLVFLFSCVSSINDFMVNLNHAFILKSKQNPVNQTSNGKNIVTLDVFNIESFLTSRCDRPTCYNRLFKHARTTPRPNDSRSQGVKISYTLEPSKGIENIILKQTGMKLRSSDNVNSTIANIPDTPVEGKRLFM